METSPKLFQISLRTLLELTAVAAVGIALFYGRIGASERYRVVSEQRPGTFTPYMLMYDTQTGQSWALQADETWTKIQMPPGLGK